jgi:uncharacterized membrane protein YccC
MLIGGAQMALTPQQLEAEDRRAKEDERKRRDIEWREAIRAEDLNWRTTTRSQELAWRQKVRAEELEYRAHEAAGLSASREEDMAYRQSETDWRVQIRTEEANWRETQLRVQSDETRRANRRYALLAATQSIKSGSDIKDVLKLAANFAAWLELPDKTGTK